MKQFISYDQYIALSQDQRDKIRELFRVKKSGGMSVQDNQIVSDGTNPTDLAVINLGAMIEYLVIEDADYCNVLWKQVLEKALAPEEEKPKPQPVQPESEDDNANLKPLT